MGNVALKLAAPLAGTIGSTGKGTIEILNDLAERKQWTKLEEIFKDNPTLAFVPEKSTGRLAVHLAVLKNAPASLIQVLLAANTQSAGVLDAAGESPLHYAIAKQIHLDLVQLFIERNPSSVGVCDAQGLLPLHKALEYKASFAVVEQLLRSDAESAAVKTKDGKLALHYACEHNAPLEIIKLLAEAYPGAASEIHNGRLPLHYACENKAPLEVITVLHKTNKSGVACKGVDGKQPLHMAVQHRSAVSVVEFLVQAHADALLHRDRKGLHPIHYALERVAPDAIVRCILKHRPESAQLRGKGSPGNFPLSTAIDKHYCPDIVRLVLQSYPAAAGEKNMLGFWPLQCCMKSKVTDIALLTEILAAHPPAASLVDEHHRVVLHYAASRNMDLAFVKALLETDKNSASAIDKNGQNALHLAVKRGNMELIKLLLVYHPNGVIDVDRYGMVPLNYAVEIDAGVELIRLLVATNPLCTQNVISGHRTVLHQAVEFRRSTDVIQVLVSAYPEATRIQEGASGRLPLHWAIERLLPLPTLLCIDDANPTDGAYVSDHQGWRSIHYAVHYPTPTPIVQRLLRANLPLTQAKNDSLHISAYSALRAKNPALPAVVPTEKDVFMLVHYAVTNSALPETVAEVLMYTMPYSTHGAFNANHCDTWSFVTSHCGDNFWRSIDIVLSRYEHDQPLILKLAEFRDQQTQRCIDTATPRSLHEILRRMYYFSRYEMHKQLSLHLSKYSLSHSAIYHNTTFGATIVNNPTNLESLSGASGRSQNTTSSVSVVLKFTNHRSKFIREVSVRTLKAVPVLDTDFVVPLLGYHNAQEDLKYAAEIQLKNFTKYPFLLVCKQGDRDLSAITKHEHIEVTDLPTIRTYMRQLLRAVQYLHDVAGVVHGDIKPSNIIRESGVLKLTNFGAATKYRDRELVSAELQQLAYACPELALLQRYHDMLSADAAETEDGSASPSGETPHFANQRAQLMNKSYTNAPNDGEQITQGNDLFPVPNQPGERILSAPNQDMWSVGCVFYLLLTGESLFLNTSYEDVDSDQLDILTEWPEFVKQKRLDKIRDKSARCLLSQLLSRNPLQRPSARYCLQHPFCMETVPLVRYFGAPLEFEVYLCYRREKLVPIPTEQECIQESQDVTSQEEKSSHGAPEENKNLSAMQRMFGNISLTDSEAPEDSLSLEEGSIGADSQELSAAGDKQEYKTTEADATADITKADGRWAMLREYFDELGTTAASTLQSALVVPIPAPVSTAVPLTPVMEGRESAPAPASAAGGMLQSAAVTMRSREVALSKCGAAVIVLSKDTWRALEEKCAELARANKAAQRKMALSSMKATTSTKESKLEKTEEQQRQEEEQRQLLDDFLYEVRLILELQSMGLLENGVYVMAAGEPTTEDAHTGHTTGTATGTATAVDGFADRVLGEYFQQYMSDMVGRYGGSHPSAAAPNFVVPELESRLSDCLSLFGYGVASNHTNLTLNELFRYLVRLPTFHIIGPERSAFRAATESISGLIFRSSRILRHPVQSRPNTGAFNMLSGSRIGSPQLVSDQFGPINVVHSGPSSKNNSFSLNNSNVGSFAGGHSMASITSGIVSGVGAMGSTVYPDMSSRALLRTSSGRKSRAVTPLAPLQHSRPSSSDPSLHLLAPMSAGTALDPLSAAAHRSARSPISGLRVRTFTPSKSPRHTNFADNTASTTALGPLRTPSAGRRAVASPLLSGRGFGSSLDLRPDHSSASIPVRPWSGVDAGFTNGSFRNTTSFRTASGAEDEDFTHENEVAFYNNQDIVTMPYFTEIVGEDRVRTANAITYMSTKLEASENQIANLEDELALLRAQMSTKDVELTHLRSVVAATTAQSPLNASKKKVRK